jgi:hypothetical protein
MDTKNKGIRIRIWFENAENTLDPNTLQILKIVLAASKT